MTSVPNSGELDVEQGETLSGGTDRDGVMWQVRLRQSSTAASAWYVKHVFKRREEDGYSGAEFLITPSTSNDAVAVDFYADGAGDGRVEYLIGLTKIDIDKAQVVTSDGGVLQVSTHTLLRVPPLTVLVARCESAPGLKRLECFDVAGEVAATADLADIEATRQFMRQTLLN